jgi:hypothetical protein
MVWRRLGLSLLAGAGLVLGAAIASAQPSGRNGHHSGAGGFRAEPLTPFEADMLQRMRADGLVHEDDTPPPADNNARGLILDTGDAAIVNLAVRERKYGISLDGTGDVLIKNFSFVDRRSKDHFGSGLILGQKKPTRGETFLSNAYIDLKERGPNPDYRRANNEDITVERGNGVLNVRQAVLIGAEESGLDNKGDVRMDAVFIASGHRPVRIWSGASLLLTNCIVLAAPDFGGFWFGGGDGVARLDYYNCKFGRIGDSLEDLGSEIPDWMVAREDEVDARITRLRRDPLDRSPDSFWIPVATPIPRGFLDR